jgi:hypothetical protein
MSYLGGHPPEITEEWEREKARHISVSLTSAWARWF